MLSGDDILAVQRPYFLVEETLLGKLEALVVVITLPLTYWLTLGRLLNLPGSEVSSSSNEIKLGGWR